MEASWPSKRAAAVTKRILCFGNTRVMNTEINREGSVGKSKEGGNPLAENLSQSKSSEEKPAHHSLTYGTSRLAPPIRLVDRAKEIELAEESVQLHVHGKMEVIAKQIRALKAEAEILLQNAQKDIELHKVKCHFEKKAGQALHLYEKKEGNYFSLLSPAEWGGSPPHRFVASYIMNPDRSFTEVTEDEETI